MERSLMTQLPAPSSLFNCHSESNFANIHWKLSKHGWIPVHQKQLLFVGWEKGAILSVALDKRTIEAVLWREGQLV